MIAHAGLNSSEIRPACAIIAVHQKPHSTCDQDKPGALSLHSPPTKLASWGSYEFLLLQGSNAYRRDQGQLDQAREEVSRK